MLGTIRIIVHSRCSDGLQWAPSSSIRRGVETLVLGQGISLTPSVFVEAYNPGRDDERWVSSSGCVVESSKWRKHDAVRCVARSVPFSQEEASARHAGNPSCTELWTF